jgi:hypothetical protein
VRRIRHIVCAAVVAAIASPDLGGAATPRPGAPSIDQYIEAIPTSAGPQSTVGGAERVQPLTVELGREVEAKAGSDADALTKIATSSRYGAPVKSKPAETGNDPDKSTTEQTPAETGTGADRSALEQIPASQTAENVELRLVGLVAFMAASFAAAAYAWTRRRSRPSGR